jgi:IS4 transposase
VDSTTIQLVANSLDWAKHRRRKAAAKCHLRLNLQSLLPRFAIVDTARHADAKRAREVCAGLQDGEIVIFDKAYVDLSHLFDLFHRGVCWVSRAKEGMKFRVVRRLQRGRCGNILRDDLVQMKSSASRRAYPAWLRRVVALVEIEGQVRQMEFLSSNLEWSAHTIVDLYRCRWDIETFFKEIKQTLQLSDFLGHNANAVRWQIWMALVTYLLLRFCAFVGQWPHSFTRLFTLLRSAMWQKLDLHGLLETYGTAGGHFRFLGAPEQAYLPGLR